MSLSTVDTERLTSIHGVGREEAKALAALFAAAQADSLVSITTTQRRGLDLLVSLGLVGSREVTDLLTALANRIADTPDAAQDADVVNLFKQRLVGVSRSGMADVLAGLYA